MVSLHRQKRNGTEKKATTITFNDNDKKMKKKKELCYGSATPDV